MTGGHEEDIEPRLARLARETAAVRPRAGFDDRVMAAIAVASGAGAPTSARTGGSWIVDVLGPARRLLPALVLTAAAGIVWAVNSDRAADDATVAVDTVDVDW